MKIHLYLLLYLCVFIFINKPNIIVEANSENGESSFINSYEEDITGDGLREYFKLQGTLFSNKSNYYRDVWLNITSPFSKQWKISLNGGYDPSLQLIDLNHDHIFDLFFQIARDENNLQYQYHLYTLKNGTINQIPLPKHNYIQGKFVNGFKVKLQIYPNSKPLILDVSNMKSKYIEHDIYDEEGTLLNEKRVIVNPISYMKPTLISESKGYGLKSYQSIKGIEDDMLGEIETLWYFKSDEWIILKSDWVA